MNSSKHELEIREFCASDVDILVDSFARHNWHKPRSTFTDYLKEQHSGHRQMWVAYVKDELAGYVTLNWHSSYWPFSKNGVPEIADLNVLLPFRKRGIGSALLDIAEEHAAHKSPTVGIGVGLYDGYGAAQKLYVQRGYIPDGRGPTYRYIKLNYGQSVTVDDDLVMWFKKQLHSQLRKFRCP
jgi:GNAT superfamily N-acetyltransferase